MHELEQALGYSMYTPIDEVLGVVVGIWSKMMSGWTVDVKCKPYLSHWRGVNICHQSWGKAGGWSDVYLLPQMVLLIGYLWYVIHRVDNFFME